MEQFGLSNFTHPIDAIDMPILKSQFSELYRRRAEVGRELRARVTQAEAELQAQREQFVAELLLSRSSAGSFRHLSTITPPAIPSRRMSLNEHM
jgi:hypothetical protein